MKIGVDGGGTKTELILLDHAGRVAARQLAAGSNPSLCGPEAARSILTDALAVLTRGVEPSDVTLTLLCMAGSRSFWQETAAGLSGYGHVLSTDDSLPVLELATGGEPGLVLHGGTGSFVAARTAAGVGDAILQTRYAGGLGWRLGDPGSGHDLGRRALARGVLEAQGWKPASRVGAAVQAHTGLADASALSRFIHGHAEPNRMIAALARVVLDLAAEGEPAAGEIVSASIGELLALAEAVAAAAFPDKAAAALRAGFSGPILTHPAAAAELTRRTALPLVPVTEAPVEGVRRLLSRLDA